MNDSKKLFSPIKNERTFEQVSSKIKRLIFDGVLKPGDRLPAETELAQQFSVSRQSIREALRILELSGFITVQKGGGGGPLIKNTILNTINELFLDAFQMDKIPMKELTTARFEIERMVLGYVIKNADDEDIQKIQENVQKSKMKIDNNIMATDENIEFHNLLAKASKNHVFVIVVGSIMAVVRETVSRLTPELGVSKKPVEYNESILKSKHAFAYHEKILDAIIARDLDLSIQLMEEHLLEVGERLQLFI